MGLPDLLNHVLNFIAPAFWIAIVVTLAARLFMSKHSLAPVLHRQAAINFIVSLVALAAGLWFFGRDAKMSTYSAMALLCATSQWAMLRSWRA